jgi:hypothetical protein
MNGLRMSIWVLLLVLMMPYGFDGRDVGGVLQRKLGSKSIVKFILVAAETL